MTRRRAPVDNGSTGALTDYVLPQSDAPDLERARFRLLAEVHDPLTRAQLDAIGVGRAGDASMSARAQAR